MTAPENIIAIGNEIAIKWSDGTEDYYPMDRLRELSPSAETQGEKDLLGQHIGGGDGTAKFPGVTVTGWEQVGSYAVMFRFSDGHTTGIYGYDYLKRIAEALR